MIFSPFQIQRETRSEGIMGTNENDVNDMWNSIVATMQKPPQKSYDSSPHPHQPKKKKGKKKKKKRNTVVQETAEPFQLIEEEQKEEVKEQPHQNPETLIEAQEEDQKQPEEQKEKSPEEKIQEFVPDDHLEPSIESHN